MHPNDGFPISLRGVSARAGDTLVVRMDVLRVINDLAPGATLAEGQTVRIGKKEPYRPRR